MTKAISHQKKKECIDYTLAHPEIEAAKLAADFGIGHSTLSSWLKKAWQQGVQGASRSLTAEQTRIKDLEKENFFLPTSTILKAHSSPLLSISMVPLSKNRVSACHWFRSYFMSDYRELGPQCRRAHRSPVKRAW